MVKEDEDSAAAIIKPNHVNREYVEEAFIMNNTTNHSTPNAQKQRVTREFNHPKNG